MPSSDGWLNRHVPGVLPRDGHNWRLVRATLNDGTLTLRVYPGVAVKAFDSKLQGPKKPPKPVKLTTSEEELCQNAIHDSEAARILPFVVNFEAALNYLATLQIEPQRAANLIRCALYPGLVLNEAVHAGLQTLADQMGRSDANLSTALKKEIYEAFNTASDYLPQNTAPAPEDPLSSRLNQLARAAGALWLPPDLFLNEDFSREFGTQIAVFHTHFWAKWPPTEDPSILFHFDGASAVWRLNPLVFDLDTPHFLGSLVLAHAFASNISERTRGELLSAWIKLGDRLRSSGDIVGWIAIATILCTPAVLRLRDAWSYVAPALKDKVSHECGFEVFELEKRASIDLLEKSSFRASTEELGEAYPKSACVPYFGDVIISKRPTPESAAQELDRLAAVTDGWFYYFENTPDMHNPPKPPTRNPYFQDLFAAWLRLNATLPNPLTSAYENSLQIQPKNWGNYLQHHYSQALPLAIGSFVPVLFTEPIPAFRLLAKSSLAQSATATTKLPSPRRPSARHLQISGPSIELPTSGSLHRSNSFPPLTTGVRELEMGPREYLSRHTGSPHVLVKAFRDLLNVGVKTYLIGTDLVLKSCSVDKRSSRHSSIFELTSQRSLDLLQKRQSVQSIELANKLSSMDVSAAIDVVVKAASLPKLVDTLVLGVGEYSNGGNRFKINLPVHTETFLATFRSFCSPDELLRMFETRFFGAASAAFSIVQNRTNQANQTSNFPSWASSSEVPSGQAMRVVTQIYCNILEALQFWVTEYYSDFIDNADLTNNMRTFLMRIEYILSNPAYQESLGAQARKLNATFVKLRYKAPDSIALSALPPVSRHMVHLVPQPENEPLQAMERYIDDMDAVVAEHFGAVSLPEWMQLFEIMEMQTADPLALFNYSPSSTTAEDELPIEDIFTYLASLYKTNPKDRTFSYLPNSLKALFKLHVNITDYFAYQITDPMLHVLNRNRVSRLAYVLKLLGILRTRMKHFDLFPNTTEEFTTRVPAFLESAIVAAILKPESRWYAVAWLKAGRDLQSEFGAANDHASVLSLGSTTESSSEAAPQCAVANSHTIFIPHIPSEMLGEGGAKSITPCAGWVLERLLEIVCYVPNMSVEHPDLINFDKRRYAYNLVKNIQNEFSKPVGANIEQLYAQYDYLINLDPSLYKLDKRAIKDSVARELQGLPKWQHKQKAFTGCVSAELDKMRLEAKQYDMLMGRQSSTLPLSSSVSSVSLLEKRLPRVTRPLSSIVAAPPSSSGSSATSADRERKSRSRFGAGLLKAVRPLSMAFSSSSASPVHSTSSSASGGLIVHPSQLPELDELDENSSKVVATFDLSSWEIKGRPPEVIIKLVSSSRSNQVCMLQAASEEDAKEWFVSLFEARKHAVAHAQMRPGSTKVFGVPIEIVCKREHSRIPNVVNLLLEKIEQSGLDEVGLYRISGSLTAINNLKAALDNGEKLKSSDSRWQDINAVAGCVKLYLRELPDPLLTDELFGDFIAIASINSKEEQLRSLRNCLRKLPAPNYHLLQRIIEHLNLVVRHEATNKMSTPNLAIVFSMNFLPPNAMDQMRPMQNIINTMIVNELYLFGNPATSGTVDNLF